MNHVDEKHLKIIRSTYIRDIQRRVIHEGDRVEYEVKRCSANHSGWGRVATLNDGYYLISGIVTFDDGEFVVIGDKDEIEELANPRGKEQFKRNVWFQREPLRNARKLRILDDIEPEVEVVSGAHKGNPARIIREFAGGKIQVKLPNGETVVTDMSCIALKGKSPVANNITKRLSVIEEEELRCPLAVARDEWFDSEEGKGCRSGSAEGSFLKNRLELAFLAGAKAQEQISKEEQNANDEEKVLLLHSGVGGYKSRLRN